ncbi:hypothetical protein L6241_10030 [Janibacter sp. Y6]|uniref:hypothetical protein n=1 Tax=Janibacter sp. Y6 TaxID=2913552 RepID=UPI0034A37BF5
MPWHVSRTGRNLMLKAAAVAALATVSLLSRVDEVTGLPIKQSLDPLLVAAYTALAYAYSRWIRGVLHDHDDEDQR